MPIITGLLTLEEGIVQFKTTLSNQYHLHILDLVCNNLVSIHSSINQKQILFTTLGYKNLFL